MGATAELKALRTQIHPHFLFNALNTISFLCRTDPSKARELIVNLSNYFRKTLKKEEDLVPLKDELDLILSYMSIEEARFGDKLKLLVDVPEHLYHVKIPAFILQPLVENSIKHGLSCTPEGGTVSVSAKLQENHIIFTVNDTGIGMDNANHKKSMTRSSGIGLQNVNNRLKYIYGINSTLNIKSTKNIGTEISFKIPMEVL